MRIFMRFFTSLLLLIIVLSINGCDPANQNPAKNLLPEEPNETGYWDFHGVWQFDGKGVDPRPRGNKPRQVPIFTEPLTVLNVDDLPDELPYPMTANNIELWQNIFTELAKDLELMKKYLPDTKKRAFETKANFGNLNMTEGIRLFEKTMWVQLLDKYPNDSEVLFFNTLYMPRGKTATREQKRAFVALWERLKKVNDSNNIPIISGLRKTYGLSQEYIDLGEYEKAIQNIEEQNRRIGALKEAGLEYRQMYYGLMRTADVPLKLLREQQAKQSSKDN